MAGISVTSITKERVGTLINDFLCAESMEEAFNSFMLHQESNETAKMQTFEQSLMRIVTSTPQEEMETLLVALIGHISEQTCKRMRKLLHLVERCVINGSLSAKLVCDGLLGNESLSLDRRDLWVETFQLLRRIVSRVDYKGVRELMKVCLEKARLLPADIDESTRCQCNALFSVVRHIFDREAALLPAYFINNEIVRSYPDCRNFPHWKLASMLESFIASFRPTAQMVTMIGRQNMLPIVEYAAQPASSWRLDPGTLRFQVKGNLPYDKSVLQPQRALLAHMVRQPYSREVVCLLLGLQKQQKQRCPALEEILVELIVTSMEQIEQTPSDAFTARTIHLWQHISAQLIYFVVFCFSDFGQVVIKLNDKLKGRKWDASRDHLMWILLHYISGSISKNTLAGFLPVLGLLCDLYGEYDSVCTPLPLPDCARAEAAVQMSAVSIWTHLQNKASTDLAELPVGLPAALLPRQELLHQLLTVGLPAAPEHDFRLALVCNAFSTQADQVQRHMNVLVEATQGGQQRTSVPMPGTNCAAAGPTVPLSMALLDALTIHAKMSLIHSISLFITKMAAASAQHKMAAPVTALPPALVETYSRLLVYAEIDTLGIKNLTGTLLPTVFKTHALGILHTLLELFCYRLRHVQPHYRLTLLSTVHSLANAPQTNHTQMHLCLETTALRTISGLGNAEIQTQMARYLGEPKSIVSTDSEELNRVLVLNIVRALHITGSDGLTGLWCRDILNAVMQATPHVWPRHTLELFPAPVREFFNQRSDPRTDKQQLRNLVDEEYRKYMSINNENDIISHFSIQGSHPFFICLLWKMLVETNRISPIAYKVLERGGPRALTAHLRTFCDYLIHMFSTSPDGGHFKKYVDAVSKLVWTYNIIPMDRLILCLILRPNESNELRMCYLLIQMLLLTPPSEMIDRIKHFVAENDPRYWEQDQWQEKHMAFHQRFPERFAPEDFLAEQQNKSPQAYQSLPVYFSNICLRFLPVFDILIQRILESPQGDAIGLILDQMGSLYKFHDRPVTFLYNTLHYYERPLAGWPQVKRKLVSVIAEAQSEVRPRGWFLTDEFQTYLSEPADSAWTPQLGYLQRLLRRLVDTLADRPDCVPFPIHEWRFSEFPNASTHALYCSCVEVMALPGRPDETIDRLLELLVAGYPLLSAAAGAADVASWCHALGLLVSWLPEPYWRRLLERLLGCVATMAADDDESSCPLATLRLEERVADWSAGEPVLLLAVAHGFWNHASVGQVTALLAVLRARLRDLVRTEAQFIYVCHLVAPFLERLNTSSVFELTRTLYESLEQVDRSVAEMRYMDQIADLLYHIKYMYTGDSTKAVAGRVIRALRPALQRRLRFITHLNLDEITPRDESQQLPPPQLPAQPSQPPPVTG